MNNPHSQYNSYSRLGEKRLDCFSKSFVQQKTLKSKLEYQYPKKVNKVYFQKIRLKILGLKVITTKLRVKMLKQSLGGQLNTAQLTKNKKNFNEAEAAQLVQQVKLQTFHL